MSTSLQGVNGFPPIAIAFSSPPDPSILNDPTILNVYRTTLVDYYGRIKVSGTWSILQDEVFTPDQQPVWPGTVVLFTPNEAFLENSRYDIEVSTGAFTTDSDGARYYLPRPVAFSFLSKMRPFFCDPYAVRKRLGRFSDKVTNEVLFYEIFKASMTANRERMLFVTPWWGGPSVGNVTNWTFVITYATRMFTECEATIQIMNTLIAEYTDEVDRRHKGLDFETEVEEGLIKNLDLALKMIKREREPYYAEISAKRPRPRNTQKAAGWPGGRNHLSDRSYAARGTFR